MEKKKKSKDEELPYIQDPEMLDILQSNVDNEQRAVNRAKEYVRAAELKLEAAKDKLEKYKKGDIYRVEIRE